MWYKGTKEQCESYNRYVTNGENYQGGTLEWADVEETNGQHYIKCHPRYHSTLEIINELPKEELI